MHKEMKKNPRRIAIAIANPHILHVANLQTKPATLLPLAGPHIE
jgi:hypothetical protein